MSLGFDTLNSIPEAFHRIVEELPERALYLQAQPDPYPASPSKPRSWTVVTARESAKRIQRIAHALKQFGVASGDRVAILSNTRPEWLEADLAILSIGAISVSIYQSLPPLEVAYILHDSGAKLVFAENQEQVDKILSVLGRPVPIAANEDRSGGEYELSLQRIISFESVLEHPSVVLLDQILQSKQGDESRIVAPLTRSSLATLVYTSGTTGPPKGVIQTHGNHLANVRQVYDSGIVSDGMTLALFLPLAHSFARLMGYVGFLTPVQLKFPAITDRKSSRTDRESVTRDIREGNAHVVPVVPRMLEKMRDAIVHRSRLGTLAARVLKLCLETAQAHYSARESGKSPSLRNRILYSLTTSIRRDIRRRLFGSEFRYAVSGGAKLDIAVGRFFDSLEIEILEGYGLTETCVATNVNRPGAKKLGTVGPVLAPDIEMKLLADGEICFRGPNVTMGYYNRPTATHAAWDRDGWFSTGDLGLVDGDGFLTITGRKKDLIKTSGGKYVSPSNVEERLRLSPFISQAVVIGDGRPYCIALLTLNADEIRAWAEREKVGFDRPMNLDRKVIELISQAIQDANKMLASFESVKKFAILDEDFTVENGYLTPTLKVKRKLVEKDFADVVNGLY